MKKSEWNVSEALHALFVKFWVADSPVANPQSVIIKVKVNGLELAHRVDQVPIRTEENPDSPRRGEQFVEIRWQVSFTAQTIETIKVL